MRKSLSHLLVLVLGVLFVVGSASGSAWAISLGVEIQSGSTSNEIINFTVGWSFRVNEPILVEALAYFDLNGDGLLHSYPVGLWTADGTNLLASAVIPSGSPAILDSFRLSFIEPLVLMPNEYVIGAVANTRHTGVLPGPDRVIDLATITTGAVLTFLENRASTVESTNLLFPDTTFPAQGIGFFGPNLAFSVVPEPSTIFLFGFGLAWLAAATWRRRSHTLCSAIGRRESA